MYFFFKYKNEKTAEMKSEFLLIRLEMFFLAEQYLQTINLQSEQEKVCNEKKQLVALLIAIN